MPLFSNPVNYGLVNTDCTTNPIQNTITTIDDVIDIDNTVMPTLSPGNNPTHEFFNSNTTQACVTPTEYGSPFGISTANDQYTGYDANSATNKQMIHFLLYLAWQHFWWERHNDGHTVYWHSGMFFQSETQSFRSFYSLYADEFNPGTLFDYTNYNEFTNNINTAALVTGTDYWAVKIQYCTTNETTGATAIPNEKETFLNGGTRRYDQLGNWGERLNEESGNTEELNEVEQEEERKLFQFVEAT